MAHGPIQVLVSPDYRVANPYQGLLEATLHPRFVIGYGGPDEARTRLRQAGGDEAVLCHIHWEDKVHREAADAADAMACVEACLDEVHGFVAEGGGLIWTVHNIEPHGCRFGEAQARLAQGLGVAAHRVTAHGVAALAALTARGVAPAKLALVPHGNFIGVHGAAPDRAAARAALGIEPETRLALLFGRLSPYKGIGRLMGAMSLAAAKDLQVALVGKAVYDIDRLLDGLVPEVRERVLFRPGFVEDEALVQWLAAAHAAVLPYEEITTSGSAMLALSYGLPVIVPDHPGIEELVWPEREGLVFRANDTASLAGALDRFAGLTPERLAEMSGRARARAEMFPWAMTGGMMSALYADVAAGLGARRRPVLG